MRVALGILYDVMYSRGEGTLGENIPTPGNIPGILAAKLCQSSVTFSGFLSDRRAFMMFLSGCLIYKKNTEKQQQQQQQNIIEQQHWIFYLPPTEKGYLRLDIVLVAGLQTLAIRCSNSLKKVSQPYSTHWLNPVVRHPSRRWKTAPPNL